MAVNNSDIEIIFQNTGSFIRFVKSLGKDPTKDLKMRQLNDTKKLLDRSFVRKNGVGTRVSFWDQIGTEAIMNENEGTRFGDFGDFHSDLLRFAPQHSVLQHVRVS